MHGLEGRCLRFTLLWAAFLLACHSTRPRHSTLPIFFSGKTGLLSKKGSDRTQSSHAGKAEAQWACVQSGPSSGTSGAPPSPLLKSPEKQSLHFPLSPEVKKAKQLSTTGSFRSRKGQQEQLVTPVLLALPAQTPGPVY